MNSNNYKYLFEKYQPLLVKLANTSVGRRYLNINDQRSIVKITTSGVHYFDKKISKDKFQYTLEVYPREFYAQKLSHLIRCLEAISTVSLYNLTRSFGLHGAESTLFLFPLTTDTFSPTGKLLRGDNITPGAATWGSQRTGTDANTTADLGNQSFHNCDETGGSDGWWLLNRCFMWFDASSIVDGATKTSGKIVFPAVSTLNSDNSFGFGFTGHTAASTPTTSDYDSCTINSPTEYTSRKALSALSTSVTTDVALNASGLAAVSLTVSTPILLRGNLDIDNTTPNTSVYYNEPSINTANFVLSVTYTAGTDYTTTLTETTVSLTESLVKAATRILTESTVSLTEALVKAGTRIITETTVALTSSVSSSFIFVREYTETAISTAESLVRDVTRILTESTVSLTSSIAAAHGYIASLTETTITLTEATISRGFARVLSTTTTLAEQFNKLKNGVNTVWTKVARTTSTWTKKGRNE